MVVRPGAFGLFFDLPSPISFLGPDGKPREGCLLDGGIGVLSIEGPLEHHGGGWCCWANYDDIRAQVEIALRHPEVRALVLKVDSPGGVAAGMGQLHRAIRRLRAEIGKPVIAWVDEMACSAAYSLASACDEIWTPPEAVVGSIGVILCTIDESAALEKAGVAVRYVVTGRRKADLHPGAPVTDEVLKVAQAKVDELGARFFASVAQSRGMTPASVEALQAAVFMGPAAVAVGLADACADWPEFLGTLRGALGATV
jgi:signal peptide peptidase SppA